MATSLDSWIGCSLYVGMQCQVMIIGFNLKQSGVIYFIDMGVMSQSHNLWKLISHKMASECKMGEMQEARRQQLSILQKSIFHLAREKSRDIKQSWQWCWCTKDNSDLLILKIDLGGICITEVTELGSESVENKCCISDIKVTWINIIFYFCEHMLYKYIVNPLSDLSPCLFSTIYFIPLRIPGPLTMLTILFSVQSNGQNNDNDQC